MIRSLFYMFVALLVSISAWPKADLELAGSIRSVPWGGHVGVKSGYSYKVWGEKSRSTDFMFGYIRPSLTYNTALTYNAGVLELDVFPISIFGVTAGISRRENLREYSAYDCGLLLCEGKVDREFIHLKTVVAAKGVTLIGGLNWDELWSESRTLSFVDEVNGIAALPGYDSVRSWWLALAYKWNDQIDVALYNKEASAMGSQQTSRLQTLNVVYKYEDWKLMLGLGRFSSPLKRDAVTAVGRLSWAVSEKLGFL